MQPTNEPTPKAAFLPAEPPYTRQEVLYPVAAEPLLAMPWPALLETTLTENVRRAVAWLESRARREHAYNAPRAEAARSMAAALSEGRAVERYGGTCARLFLPGDPADAFGYVLEPAFRAGARSRLPLEETLVLELAERLRRFALRRAAAAPDAIR